MPGALCASLLLQGVLGPAALEDGGPGVAAAGLLAVPAELAGRSLDHAPWFEHARVFHEGDGVELAVDPRRRPALRGATVDAWIVEHRSLSEWIGNPKLAGAVRGPLTLGLRTGGLRENVFRLDKGTLPAQVGSAFGRGYDVVLDLDRNGYLDGDDLVDGLGDVAGFYVCRDPGLPGPYTVEEIKYSGPTAFLRQDTYFPSDVASLGELPLIVISHGNGHDYQWYDHLGYHLASHGFVVMSHRNDTGPGIESASLTTLDNVEYLLGNLDTIADGLLQGHVDHHHMAWFGHSRGGEGVTRAYDRLHRGRADVTRYQASDVKLISSIAPTVFLQRGLSTPRTVPFSLWTGGADSDVNGCADCPICQTFRLLERSNATRASISLHGVGHGDFHDGSGGTFADGPCLVGRPATHDVMRGYSLPLVAWFLRGEPAGEDYLWRQWEGFQPPGAPRRCVRVDLMYRHDRRDGTFVLDDYEAEPDPHVSSAGTRVDFDVEALTEATLDDGDTDFDDDGQDPMNGMTGSSGEPWRGVVFQWDGADRHYSLEVPPAARDLRTFEFLSLRAAQVTRHPLTLAQRGDLVFSVRLVDGALRESTLRIDAWEGGVEEPYARDGCGRGRGWANEFETIRMRLTDFTHETDLDLSDVGVVQLLFGPSHGASFGRIGLDDVQLEPFATTRSLP